MKTKIIAIFKNFVTPDHLIKRIIIVIIACSLMALSASWLNLTALGTDSYTNMNLAISGKIGISIGNWQAILNSVLLILVIFWGTGNNIGFGTLVNMFLIGYEIDYFTVMWNTILPANFFDSLIIRFVCLIPGTIVFILSAALYMDIGLGTSPCDSIAFILHERVFKKLPFRVVRMSYDFILILIAYAINGKIYPFTIIMALCMGPAVEWVSKKRQDFS